MRVHVCRIVGDGTDDRPYEPDVPPGCSGWSAVLPPDPARFKWCLVVSPDGEHPEPLSDADSFSFPPLDDGDRPALARGDWDAKIAKRLGRKPKCGKLATFRELVEDVGGALDPSFRFDGCRVKTKQK